MKPIDFEIGGRYLIKDGSTLTDVIVVERAGDTDHYRVRQDRASGSESWWVSKFNISVLSKLERLEGVVP